MKIVNETKNIDCYFEPSEIKEMDD